MQKPARIRHTDDERREDREAEIQKMEGFFEGERIEEEEEEEKEKKARGSLKSGREGKEDRPRRGEMDDEIRPIRSTACVPFPRPIES